ncbi:CocE/NonD family hydrolase [Alicyclobacillus herbarius]|uniref:CocE/NonD family hydrolase n=1 Tax=Alicyclobacillus herbarius TaxID=122960 RepID=UPI002354DC2F|nr:CocE/NonD family hydrolase [Alicyclobacillus herbarius]
MHSGGRANSLFGNGVLSPEPPSTRGIPEISLVQSKSGVDVPETESDTYVYDPRTPVPFITEPTSSQIGGPDDYKPIHRRDDVLVYTSDPLTEPLEVIGPVRMRLFASTTTQDTDFMVQLHDVWPNGYAQRLCDGMVRARFRNGMDRPELVEPGAVIKYDIDCWNTCHTFLPGHRIRVHITSSAFPKYDRNPNTGEPLGHTLPVLHRQFVSAGTRY